MGVLFDYFSAASDEAAASVITLRGGPGVSAAAPGRVGWFKPRRATSPTGAWFETVSAKGIDPLVQMGTLEALLTGRDYDQIVAGPRAGQTLASQDRGERSVVTLTDELRDALAHAGDERLTSVAVPWSRTDEFFGQGDPQLLAGVLRELAELAREPRAKTHACTAGSVSDSVDGDPPSPTRSAPWAVARDGLPGGQAPAGGLNLCQLSQ